MAIDPGNAVLFFGLAIIAVVAAGAMLMSNNAVHAALFLVLNFATVAILYLTLNAPFIALAQVAVYAGAIMVLFLFVIMLLGAERIPLTEPLRWQRPLALVLILALGAEAIYALVSRTLAPGPAAPIDPTVYGSPAQIGMVLFSRYSYPFEITSILLLVGMIGAVVLTKTERRPAEPRVIIESQITEAGTPVNGRPVNGYSAEPERTRQRL